MSALANVVRQIVAQTVAAGKPSDYIIGVVENTSPLTIRVDQKETITSEFLILTDLVRDHEVDIEVNHVTENRAGGSGDPAFASHNHDYTGRKKVKICNGLSVGESVILIRQSGGQEYIVLSRIFGHTNTVGQWG